MHLFGKGKQRVFRAAWQRAGSEAPEGLRNEQRGAQMALEPPPRIPRPPEAWPPPIPPGSLRPGGLKVPTFPPGKWKRSPRSGLEQENTTDTRGHF